MKLNKAKNRISDLVFVAISSFWIFVALATTSGGKGSSCNSCLFYVSAEPFNYTIRPRPVQKSEAALELSFAEINYRTVGITTNGRRGITTNGRRKLQSSSSSSSSFRRMMMWMRMMNNMNMWSMRMMWRMRMNIFRNCNRRRRRSSSSSSSSRSMGMMGSSSSGKGKGKGGRSTSSSSSSSRSCRPMMMRMRMMRRRMMMTNPPTARPTFVFPTNPPTVTTPTNPPTLSPTTAPTGPTTNSPTIAPTASFAPSNAPSTSDAPTISFAPSLAPSLSDNPTISNFPSLGGVSTVTTTIEYVFTTGTGAEPNSAELIELLTATTNFFSLEFETLYTTDPLYRDIVVTQTSGTYDAATEIYTATFEMTPSFSGTLTPTQSQIVSDVNNANTATYITNYLEPLAPSVFGSTAAATFSAA